MTILLIAAVPAVLALAVLLVIRDYVARRRAERDQRWKSDEPDDSATLAQRLADLRPPVGWRAQMDRGFQRLIQRTGLGMKAEYLTSLMLLGAVLLAAPLLLLADDWWLGGLAMLAGLVLPLGVFLYLQVRRRALMQEQLPDAFFLLARSLRAGLSLEHALATVGKHGQEPLAGEFLRCVGQIQLGLTTTAALETFADRLRLPDLNGLVSIVSLHRTTGGNLPALLDRWAASTRDRNQFRGYFRSATAQARISAIALAAAVPLLLVGHWLFRPELMRSFFHSGSGMLVLSVVAGLEVLGCLWLYYLVRIDY